MHTNDTTTKKTQKAKVSDEDDTRFSTNLNLRLTLKQYKILQEKADKNGLSLSKYARKILFKISSRDTDFSSTNDAVIAQQIAIRGLRSEYKKHVKIYNTLLNTFNDLVRAKDKNGIPLVNTNQLVSILSEFIDESIEIQRDFNRFFDMYGESGEYSIARRPIAKLSEEELAKIEAKEKKTAPPVWHASPKKNNEIEYYMQKISIVGRLVKDASLYVPNNSGKSETVKEKMRFMVMVKVPKFHTSFYTVFSEKTDVFALLKKDVFVSVSGRFDQSIRRTRDGKIFFGEDGEPVIDNVIFADSVKIFNGEEG